MLTYNISESDTRRIAINMREADRLEVQAASGLSPLEVLEQGIERSAVCWCYKYRGEPLFLVGVVDGLDAGTGVIWLLGTDGIITHKRFLHKLAKSVLTEWHRRWPTLGNIVDARNVVHVRWLKSMGFTFSAPVIAGVAQTSFLPFHRTYHAPDTRGGARA